MDESYHVDGYFKKSILKKNEILMIRGSKRDLIIRDLRQRFKKRP